MNLGSFVVTGVKPWFSLKNALSPLCYVLYQCNSCIFIRLTPLQNLLAQILIWDHRGQKVFSPKNAVTSSIRLTLPVPLAKGAVSSFFFFLTICFFLLLLPHALSDFDQTWSGWPLGESLQKLSTIWPQRSCTGHRGQKGHFKGKCYSSNMLHRILTKLGQNNQQASGYKSYQQFTIQFTIQFNFICFYLSHNTKITICNDNKV